MNPKELLEQHDLLPRKSLGQNFLHDPNALEKIASLAELTRETTVLEIGPGTGTLTEVLAQQAKRVIAVELDERLRPILEQRLEAYPNVEVIYQDILATDTAALIGGGDYVVVANVPYYITSAILRHLLESNHRPSRLIVTMQLEVAERLVAKPGDMGVLSVSAQFYAQTRIVMRLKPGIFWPRPEVDSAVVRMDTFATPPVSVPSQTLFFRVVRAGFSQKRKQLKNSLGDGLHIGTTAAGSLLEEAGIDPRRRPETLTLEEWAALTRQYAETDPG